MKKWAKTAGLLLLLLTLTACSPFRKDVFEVQPLVRCAEAANQFRESGFYHVKGRVDYAPGADTLVMDRSMQYEIWRSGEDCLALYTFEDETITGQLIKDGQGYHSNRTDSVTTLDGIQWVGSSLEAPDVWLHRYDWEEMEKWASPEIRPSLFGWRVFDRVKIPSNAGQVTKDDQKRDDYGVYFYLNGSGKFQKLATESTTGWLDTMTIEDTSQEKIEKRIEKEFQRASASE